MTSAVLRPCLASRRFHCEAAVPPALVRSRVPPRPKGVQAVLYDQYDNNAGVATLSATFTDFPNFSSDLADDFVVPGGQTWNVDSIDADGVYFNGAGPATDWNVFIYTDSAGLPGTQIFSATNIPITGWNYFYGKPCSCCSPGCGHVLDRDPGQHDFWHTGRVGLERPHRAIEQGSGIPESGRRLRLWYRLGKKAQSAFLPQADLTRFTVLTGQQAAGELLRQRLQAAVLTPRLLGLAQSRLATPTRGTIAMTAPPRSPCRFLFLFTVRATPLSW